LVQIVNQASGAYAFECAEEVYSRLTGTKDSFFSISYRPLPCMAQCQVAEIMDKPNPYYAKILFSGTSYPVSSAVAVYGDEHTPLAHNDGAVWSYEHGQLWGNGKGLGFQLTLSDGSEVHIEDCFETLWPLKAGQYCKRCATTTATTSTTLTSTTITATSTTVTRTSTTTSSVTTTSTVTSTTTRTITTTTITGAMILDADDDDEVAQDTLYDTLVPDPFYSIMTVKSYLSINLTRVAEHGLIAANKTKDAKEVFMFLQNHVAVPISKLTGSAAEVTDAVLPPSGAGGCEVTLRLHVDGNNVTNVQKTLENMVQEENEAPAEAPADKEQDQDDDDDDDADDEDEEQVEYARRLLQLGSANRFIPHKKCVDRREPLCFERNLVYHIIQNAGIYFPYTGYSIVALALLACWVICGQTPNLRFKTWREDLGTEAKRGWLIMSVFIATVFFLLWPGHRPSLAKFRKLETRCEVLAFADVDSPQCPPDPQAFAGEMLIFAFLPLLLLGMFVVWWVRHWKQDCLAFPEPEAHGPAWASPLESVSRRSVLFAFREVRAADKSSRLNRILLLVVNILLSLFVVMGSFFFLQRYQMPGRLVAWNPYKIIFELFIVLLLKWLVKKMVWSQVFGKFTSFILIILALLLSAGVCALWLFVFTTAGMVESHTVSSVRLLADLSFGAGIINVAFSTGFYSLCVFFFSVYFYEPAIRCRYIETRCLQSEADLKNLNTEHLTQGWVVYGKPMQEFRPVRLPALPEDSTPDFVNKSFVEGDSDDGQPSMARDVTQVLLPTAALATPESPIVVEIRRAVLPCCTVLLLKILDKVFSVDPGLPVWRDGAYREDYQWEAAPSTDSDLDTEDGSA